MRGHDDSMVALGHVTLMSSDVGLADSFQPSITDGGIPRREPPVNNPIEGWYPDPDGTPRLRWWNGSDWTENYIADERASNGPVTGSVPPPTTGPIDPITGTIAHATTSHIDRFTGSIARPVHGDHCPAPHRRTVHHRYCRSGHRSYRTPGRRTRRTSSCSRCPHSPRRCARATAQEVAQVLRRANHSDPKEPDHHAIITTLLVIGFSAGLALTGRMYMSATSEYKQAQQSFDNANSDLEKAKEAAK